MYRVRLINKTCGLNSRMQPVCGKSGHNYGMAILNPTLGGPVFDMSLEDYNRDKFDIVGQYRSGQLWVPEFYDDGVVKGENMPLHDDGSVTHEAPQESFKPFFKSVEGKSDSQLEGIIAGLPQAPPETPGIITELRKRAKAAGVWKKGMTIEQMKLALGEPV